MGAVIPVRALLFVAMLASLALAALSVQTWAHLQVYDIRQGTPYPLSPVPGTQITALTSVGDGSVLLLVSIMSFALSVVAIFSNDSRKLASGWAAIGGLGVLALTVYMATHLQRADDYDHWVTGTQLDYRATFVPFAAICAAAVVAIAGALAYRMTPDTDPTAISLRQQFSEARAVSTENALRLIVWLSGTLAVLAFVPWLDKHTLHLLTDQPVAMTALGDAVLFASVATACALLASQMLRNPSEVLWAGLVIAGAAMFVLAGSEVAESAQGCASNGKILGLLSTDILGPGCRGSGAYALTTGTAVAWTALITAAIVALSALVLPIVEAVSRAGSAEDEAWAS